MTRSFRGKALFFLFLAGALNVDAVSGWEQVSVIPAGTIIRDKAPDGWTHLIETSHSRIGRGDLEYATELYSGLASKFGAAMVARVMPVDGPGKMRYRLDKVAYGITTRIRQVDTVINSETQAELGAELDFVERLGLKRAEKRLANVVAKVQSDLMTVIDLHSHFVRSGKHVEVVIRRVILVHPQKGDVHTLDWIIRIDDKGRFVGVEDELNWLPANFASQLILHIDADEFALGLITEKALAISEPPKGLYSSKMPPAFKQPAVAAEFTASMQKTYLNSLWQHLANGNWR